MTTTSEKPDNQTDHVDAVIDAGGGGLDADKKPGDKKVSFIELFQFATTFDWMLMSLGIVCAVATGAAMPLMTIIFGNLINVFLVSPDDFATALEREDFIKGKINEFSLYFIYLAIGVAIAAYTYMSCWIWAGERQTRYIREQYLAAVLRQEIAWFDGLGAGEITTRITNDTHLIRDGITEKVPHTVSYLSTFIAAFVVAFTRNWPLTLVLCCIIPMIAICIGILSVFSTKYAKRALDFYSISGTLAEEVISSIRNAVAFGQQRKLATMYSKNITDAKRESIKKEIFNGVGVAAIFFIIYAAYSLAFYYGGKLITQGKLDAGGVMNVLFAVIIGAFSLGNIGPNIQAFSLAQGAAEKLYSVIHRVPIIDSSSEDGVQPDTKTKGTISVQGVSFHYPSRPNITVLNDVSFSVQAGKTVALVGPSGSGKSTIIQLLERFYDPIQGEIQLDGLPIDQYNIHWLRRQIGLVSQEPTLFKCTVAQNIAHGLVGTPHENCSEEKKMELIIEACKISNAHNFIMDLPQQYDTQVGERGFLLSGGQKQRIAIARAVVKDPSILLLDEATSALDTQSEGIVQQALERASAGRTTIVIAHRLSTIHNADDIIVMDKGKIIETGTHASLLNTNGVYRKLVELQKIKDQGQEHTGPIYTTDPSRPELKEDDIRHIPTNNSIYSTDNKGIEAGVEQKYSFWYVVYRVFSLNMREVGFICGGLFGAIVSGSIHPIYAIVFSQIMKVFAKPEVDIDDMNFWSLIFLVIGIVSFFAQLIQVSFFGISGERLTERIRNMLFASIMRQEIGWFDRENNSTGALVSALATDATNVQGMSGSTLGTVLQALVTIIVGFIVALVYGWQMTLVVMVGIPVLIGAGIVEMRLYMDFQDDTKAIYEKSAQLACEAASSIRTVASLTREQDVSHAYHVRLEEPHKACKKNAFVTSLIFAGSQSVIYLINCLAFWYGGKLFAEGKYTEEQFFVVLMAVVMGAQSAGNTFAFVPNIGKAKKAASCIIALLDREPLIDTWKDMGKRVDQIDGHVELKNVRFRYPTRPEIPVLRGLNLTVKPGQFAALVGPSGCGKSTVIGLVERFYDVLSGSVLLDGEDIRGTNINDVRKHIALVSQDVTLYDMSIRENIGFGLVDRVPSQTEVEEAAKKANIHEFILGLPQGYDTQLGNKGSQLSGGQKQRVAIARALIRNPKILLLDEATSALDAESEKVVQTALDNAAKGRTTIAVAHRLSTIQRADVIFVINNGVVAEQGTHEELLALHGQYHSLVYQQNMTS
ncbi:multidrug resistance protein MDR [Basidiobolus meristosporus CBS 931.73]|uniref:Multidrug resistance protein MDR n=1 Tax=Basidiobolus meristosporus CBS 931.73 TaxID=1314790 RepID=A0A1Y1X4R2_9FUNG|nr:multidrug resistance protein MDR [Basidiobolus meristosporus CBS 931.73]|eukprot:ORX80635.1 multidrug resistance protein MDR [Basidiobolus meristosporus CBS 931.73]